jgi:zinc protease
MKSVVLFCLVFLSCLLSSCAGLKTNERIASGEIQDSIRLNALLPIDSSIVKGQLPNGMTYYIRKNLKPENRAELRLVVDAGSILEDEEQQGLAHFCEHMAFNGTENFEKQELVNYLQSIGMRFGPDINAYTSFDETVYMLQIPTDSVEIIEKAFEILEDWAHLISFEDQEIDKERGVVVEEWRLRRGAQARIRDKQFPILLKGSKYAERLPIGKKAILDTFEYKVLRKFYADWYQPNLMALVAVGDFDVNRMKKLIMDHFSQISKDKNAPPRRFYEIPDHLETYFAIATDPEARFSRVGIYHKLPSQSEVTIQDYRHMITEQLHHRMFNQRLRELTESADPPFIFTSSQKANFMRTGDIYIVSAVVKDNGIVRGLETLLTELKRIDRYGFTESELKRTKAEALREMEQAYRERDKIRSESLAAEYIRNFLDKEPIPGIEFEWKMYQKYVPTITLSEVNSATKLMVSDKNRVVMLSAPESDEINVPEESELRRVLENGENIQVGPYVDRFVEGDLIEKLPDSGKIIEKNFIEEIGVTQWKLGNGIQMFIKPTDFKNDEVLFTSFSPGGYSLVPDSNLIPAKTATLILTESGIGNYDKVSLQKSLSDKVVSVSPYINEIHEGLSGRASPQDLEILFQLIYLYFTNPRVDSISYSAVKAKLEGIYQNREASPEAAFQDTINVTLTQYHPRYLPWSKESFSEMDLLKSLKIYQGRFRDASDFIFIFIGNINMDNIATLAEKYLAALPISNSLENWKDVTYRYPKGIIEKSLNRGIEQKSRTSIIFSGSFQYNLTNRLLANAMLEILQIKLRERIREELGGTYSIGVSRSFTRLPQERFRIKISFGSDPARTDSLKSEIFSQIDSLRIYPVDSNYLDKVKTIIKRGHETNLKENSYWLNALEMRLMYQEDPRSILEIDDIIAKITLNDIQNASKMYLNTQNYVRVVLYPEK